MLCNVAVWNPSESEKPCQCGRLISGGPLGLTDTSVPAERGYMEVIQLISMPQPASTGGLSYAVQNLYGGYYYVIVNNDKEESSELTIYYTQSAPSSLQLFPMSEGHPAECVASAMGMMCDVAIWSTSDSDTSCQCGQLINDGPLGLTDTSVPDVAGYMEVIQLISVPPASTQPGVVPVSFAQSAAVNSATGVSLDLTSGDNCAMKCFQMYYSAAATTQSSCRCLEDLSSVTTQQQYVAGDNLVSVLNFDEFLPKPDAVMACGYTAEPVDPAAGPPGTWQEAGEGAGLYDCAAACGSKGKFYGAMLPLGERRFKCWCAESVDMSAFSTAMPEVGGRAQIVDFHKVFGN
ncbi:hypothetical protein FJT64_020088 [Amphibalanus amphitrite]|uniref:Uncharacterized protein n=1 Tax=Amphibalanus amphitrite TaxID=1232801 RepID=A0A6A4WYF6_AMPAM|nr:hypothetical protein FJT64_020088 [Amphibalanus amphitrite]